jgi:uncharacterized protein
MTGRADSEMPDDPQGDIVPEPAPTGPDGRLPALDFIRGIAVLGILFSNIVAFAHPSLAYYWPPALPQPARPGDAAMWAVQYVAIDGKMRGLFSLLFGAGMVLFADRARASGAGGGLQLRRLVLLGLFGVLHYLFLFTGDILMTYAVAGLLVTGALGWPARRLLVLGIAGFLIGALYFAVPLAASAALEQSAQYRTGMPQAWQEIRQSWQYELDWAQTEQAVYGGDSLVAILAHVAWQLPGGLTSSVTFALFEAAPLMLIGMGLYRMGLFSGPPNDRLRRAGWALLGLGTVLTLPLAGWAWAAGFPPQLTSFIFQGIGIVPRLPLIVGLAIVLAGAAPRAVQTAPGRRVAAAGRMAFSNYIGTSFIMMLVFQGWALGLFGVLHRIELALVVVAGWAAMLAWSAPWLARFRQGPLEWLWRCLTYGRMFPFRR